MCGKSPLRRFCLFLASYLYISYYNNLIKKEYGNRNSLDYFYRHRSR